jgi:hypothetical protein
LAFVDDVPHCIDVSVEPDPARRALEQGARAEVLVDLAAPRVGKDASIMVRQPRGGLVVHISDHPADTTVSKPDPASKSLAMGVKPEEAFRDFLKAVRSSRALYFALKAKNEANLPGHRVEVVGIACAS